MTVETTKQALGSLERAPSSASEPVRLLGAGRPSLRELYAEHDRLWAAFVATPLGERREWSQKSYSGDSEACRLHRALAAVGEQIDPLQRDFEADLREALGPQLQEDDELARDLYGALCNVDWEHEDGSRYGCSWRYSGGLVADLRNRGEDYLDFYCSGNEGQVTDTVETALEERGWHVLEDDSDRSSERAETEAEIAALLDELGEEVSVYYEPRNEPQCWTVSLTRVPMIHEHFGSLLHGLRWLVDNKDRFPDWERQIKVTDTATSSSTSPS